MGSLQERLRFDTARGAVLDDTRRYVILRADVLMGLFDGLPARTRDEALRAFGRAVATRGTDSLRAYVAQGDPATLAARTAEAAASLGWGVWAFDTTAGRDDDADPTLRLRVENSPFAAATTRAGAPACHAIAGMLEGLATTLWQRPAQAREVECCAERGGTRCRFVARPAESTISSPRDSAPGRLDGPRGTER